MKKFGFQPYDYEFWHYSHEGIEGREISKPLDIAITEEMRGIGVRKSDFLNL